MYLKNLKRLFGSPNKLLLSQNSSTTDFAPDYNNNGPLMPKPRLAMAVGGAHGFIESNSVVVTGVMIN
jgi:hypothetical protein